MQSDGATNRKQEPQVRSEAQDGCKVSFRSDEKSVLILIKLSDFSFLPSYLIDIVSTFYFDNFLCVDFQLFSLIKTIFKYFS